MQTQLRPYQVIDKQTGKIMGRYATLRAAHNRADKLDNRYGAYRYFVSRESANIMPQIGL